MPALRCSGHESVERKRSEKSRMSNCEALFCKCTFINLCVLIDFILFLSKLNYIIKKALSQCVCARSSVFMPVCAREVGSRSSAASGCVCVSQWEGLV